MNIFYKKIDTRRCGPLKSCHPKDCNTNILFTLTRRICTIVETNIVRQKRLKELEKVLVSQEYPQNLIHDAINRAVSIPTNSLAL